MMRIVRADTRESGTWDVTAMFSALLSHFSSANKFLKFLPYESSETFMESKNSLNQTMMECLK